MGNSVGQAGERVTVAWEDDWRRWTHMTYGLIQSVSIAEKLDGGNLRNIEKAVAAANGWSPSVVGFVSAVTRQGAPQTSAINVDLQTGVAVVDAIKSSIASLLLVGTMSVTETLLVDLLLRQGVVQAPPANLSDALAQLSNRLSVNATLATHAWAVDGTHEARILRNVLVHAAGTWTQRAVDDFSRLFPAKTPPVVGTTASINVDDLFAYRRALRTVLNAAARA